MELSTKTPPSVRELKESGYKVSVQHFRFEDNRLTGCCSGRLLPQRDIDSKVVSSTGGMTEIIVTTPSGEDYRAIAKCNQSDTFNKKRAVQICLGRIIKQMISENYQVQEKR